MNNRSGGPISIQGKANSSRNAVKHGLTSNKMFVLQNENPEAWATLLDQCVAGYRPTTELEQTYVEAIAFALWRLKRIYAVQTALIDLEMDEQAETFAATYEGAEEVIRKTVAIRSLVDGNDTLSKLSRYETTLQRAHDRAVKNLKTLREMQHRETAPASRQTEIKAVQQQTGEPEAPILPKLRNELSGSSESRPPSQSLSPASEYRYPAGSPSPDPGGPIQIRRDAKDRPEYSGLAHRRLKPSHFATP